MASHPQSAHPKFKSDEVRALRGSDTDIYHRLPIKNMAKHENGSKSESVCNDIGLQAQGDTTAIEAREITVPFLRRDVLALHDEVLGPPDAKGCWSVSWASTSRNDRNDIPYEDDFRSVFQFRSIEFMIRPALQEDWPAGNPLRLR